MLAWLKELFNPKKLLGEAIDSLDLLIPALAYEIDQIKGKFATMNSTEKSLWLIDKVQTYLRKQFNITEVK